MIEKIAKNTKTENYKPEVQYIMANKKINARFYNMRREQGSNRSKFLPEVENPEPGSVIFEDISSTNGLDFHLAAQKVTQGTCTPTLYRVAFQRHAKSELTDLAKFTHEQCMNYPNWSGAVRVPAALQLANKLATLVGESIRQDVSGPIAQSYFFL